MPVYEYECAACRTQHEISQSMLDDPVRKCPQCGKMRLKKLISSTSFQLKGSGWYKDLYSSPKPAESSKKEGKTDSPPKEATTATTTASPTTKESVKQEPSKKKQEE